MITPGLQKQFRFFRANAGYVVGQRAIGALALARAEREAFGTGGRDWYVEWEWDDLDLRDITDPSVMPPGWYDKDHEVLCAVLKHGREVLGSLGGIIDPDDTYRRVVEAELALEALAVVRAEECAALGTDE